MKGRGRSFFLISAAACLAGGRNLPSYSELRAKDPQYGCELAAATRTFDVDAGWCRKSEKYARLAVAKCIEFRCLGDDNPVFWERARSGLSAAGDWLLAISKVSAWIDPADSAPVVGSVIAGASSMSLGKGAAGRTAGELAETLILEGGAQITEEQAATSEAPKFYAPIGLPRIINSYKNIDDRVNKIMK